jgi:hypothetical protein
MKVLDIKDFGPTGFRWLTLKRIAVSPQKLEPSHQQLYIIIDSFFCTACSGRTPMAGNLPACPWAACAHGTTLGALCSVAS